MSNIFYASEMMSYSGLNLCKLQDDCFATKAFRPIQFLQSNPQKFC